MFKIHYSHTWTIPASREQVWLIFERAFQNSVEVTLWPHKLSEIHSKKQTPLKAKTRLMATYKMGPLKTQLPYEIQQLIPGQRLIYRTLEEHPLEGESEIELLDSVIGTEVHWFGYYEPKSFSSLVSLLAFELYFDKVFFSELKKSTQNARKIRKTKHRISVEQIA
jgi:hypothetical protein